MSHTSPSALMPAAAPAPDLGAADPQDPQDPQDPVRSLPPKAFCIWCGTPVRYASESEARDHWGYCNVECREDFLAELGCDPEVAFNRSRRQRRRTAPPDFVRKLTAGAKAHAAGFDAAVGDADDGGGDDVDEFDDLEEPA